MMTKLVDGDTVLVKHPVVTNNKWKKGKVIWHCADKYSVRYNIVDSDSYYEIRFSDEGRLIIDINNPYWCDINIIKVDSYFKIGCSNCKHSGTLGCDEPCHKCILGPRNSRWEPCDSLKNKDKLNGNDIKTFSIDEGPFTDKIEKQDVKSFYPKFTTHFDRTLTLNALRYCVNDARAFAELMADFNKKENKNMKKQQKRRNRNILVVKDFNTAIEFDEIKFNGPATIIKWKQTFTQAINDKKADKTVTVAKEPDKFDKTTGFLLAVLKEVLDNKSYGNILEKIDEIRLEELKEDIEGIHKIGKEIVEEECKKVAEEDLIPDDEHIPKGTIALLNEAAEAMANAFHIGSRVKYIHGKLVYRVIDCAYIPTKHEMYYTLSAYQNDILNGHETPKVYNVAHHRLKQVKRG